MSFNAEWKAGDMAFYECPDDLNWYWVTVLDPEVPVGQMTPGVKIELPSGQVRVTDPLSIRKELGNSRA